MKFTLEEDEEIKKLHKRTEGLLKDNLTEEEIINELSKEGVDSHYAHTIIENVLKDLRDRRAFWFLILGGSFCIIGGFLINYFAYSRSGSGEFRVYYIFWGIIAVGVAMYFRAFILFRK